MQRKIIKKIIGRETTDGAGVHLTRVLSNNTVKDFDPFLMLDSFDSTKPEDYIAGFPMHPHRGIETITYIIQGKVDHEDSLGNAGQIESGESQWMTAGSGILHQEMFQPVERLLGVQLWLNLPAKDKMTNPQYFDITKDMIGVAKEPNATINVLSGAYKETKGVTPKFINATYYDIQLDKQCSITLDSNASETTFIFTVLGDTVINSEIIEEKTAVLFEKENGSEITITAGKNADARFIYLSAKALNEEVSWGGPIVMNTREELSKAFQELDEGTFIKTSAK